GDTRVHLESVGKVLHARDAHAHHRVLEEGIVAGNDQVADPGQHQPAGDAAALHHGNARLGHLAPAPAHVQVDFLLAHIEEFATGLVGVIPPQVPVLEALGHIPARRADVVPGGNVLAGRTQHDDHDLIIIDRAAKAVVQSVGHLRVLYVVVLRAAHGDDRHAVLHPVGHRIVGLV